MNTPPSVQASHAHPSDKDGEKPGSTVSPSTFLPGLKSFNINRSKYKHYGHLMTSEQVESMMRSESKDLKESRSSLMLSADIDVTSPLDPRRVRVENDLASDLRDAPERNETEENDPQKNDIEPESSDVNDRNDTQGDSDGVDPREALPSRAHDNIRGELNLSTGIPRLTLEDIQVAIRGLDFDIGKSYGEETVRELLRLRVEQERTKQTQYKYKLSQMVLELLKEAESHGFGGDLIRKLFLDDTSDEYKDYLHLLRSHLTSDMESGPLKRKRDESRVSVPVHTPSPNKLPVIDESTVVGQNAPSRCPSGSQILNQSMGQNLGQILGQPLGRYLQPAPVAATTANSGANSVSGSISGPSHSPNLPVYLLHVYPVYYTQMPEQVATKHDDSESLGLPYQKYPAVVFHSLPQQFNQQQSLLHQPQLHPPQSQQQQHQQQQQQQQQQQVAQGQGRPFFYVNSLPPGMTGPVMTSQYFIPPPLPSNMVAWGASAPVPEKRSDEETHHNKRQRGNKNSINFMITTPKNPPAKKYNKL